LRDLSEKHAGKRFVVVAVNAANATGQPETVQTVRQFATQNRLASSNTFTMALDGRVAAAQFGVTSQHTYFLLDRSGRIVLTGSGWSEDQEKAVTQKIDVLTGNLPPDFGWRRDIAATYTRAEESYGAGRLDEALSQIKLILPPRVLNIKADYKQLGTTQMERLASQSVQRALSIWKQQLGSIVEINVTEVANEIEIRKPEEKPKDDKRGAAASTPPKPTKPNVELIFQRSVLDPQDDAGLRTTCAVIRVLNEREMGGSVRAGVSESPFYVLGRIALGHGNEAHRLEALIHLVGVSIARSLGLEPREDDTSITKVGNVDSPNWRPMFGPSREDLFAMGNLIATMNLRIGEIHIQKKKYDEAREALQMVANLRVGAASDKASIYLRELPPATAGEKKP